MYKIIIIQDILTSVCAHRHQRLFGNSILFPPLECIHSSYHWHYQWCQFSTIIKTIGKYEMIDLADQLLLRLHWKSCRFLKELYSFQQAFQCQATSPSACLPVEGGLAGGGLVSAANCCTRTYNVQSVSYHCWNTRPSLTYPNTIIVLSMCCSSAKVGDVICFCITSKYIIVVELEEDVFCIKYII